MSTANLPEDCIDIHYLITFETDNGRRFTRTGCMPADPRTHTRESIVNALLDGLKTLYGGFTVMCLSMDTDKLPSA